MTTSARRFVIDDCNDRDRFRVVVCTTIVHIVSLVESGMRDGSATGTKAAPPHHWGEVVTMALHSPHARTIDDRSEVSLVRSRCQPLQLAKNLPRRHRLHRQAGSARGRLRGARRVRSGRRGPDADGLARASGLAKTSAYRLAEQLVGLGAIQRVDKHYYVGPRVGGIGQQWQPDPLLRRAAQTTVHALAVKSRAVASPLILREHRLRMICGTMPHGHACMRNPADPESTARTATGRVLYATQLDGDVAVPDCWTAAVWRQLPQLYP
jgi:hypothetical protein